MKVLLLQSFHQVHLVFIVNLLLVKENRVFVGKYFFFNVNNEENEFKCIITQLINLKLRIGRINDDCDVIWRRTSLLNPC